MFLVQKQKNTTQPEINCNKATHSWQRGPNSPILWRLPYIAYSPPLPHFFLILWGGGGGSNCATVIKCVEASKKIV